mmetsp:Transcript_12825/g.41890  ORF Transcript_12825/g.41890 Transcript_12825/m.41890 type:complete len:227 (-) Transcript_12825:20-700(-)
MHCKVFPRPISSARIPFIPWCHSLIIQFSPSSWYGRIVPPVTDAGCAWRNCASASSASSAASAASASPSGISASSSSSKAAIIPESRRREPPGDDTPGAADDAGDFVRFCCCWAEMVLPTPKCAKMSDCESRYLRRLAAEAATRRRRSSWDAAMFESRAAFSFRAAVSSFCRAVDTGFFFLPLLAVFVRFRRCFNFFVFLFFAEPSESSESESSESSDSSSSSSES